MGYAGIVDMYDEKYYINTETGEGFDKVLSKIMPLVYKIAKKTYIQGFEYEDIKQELTIMIVDGIKSYDPDRKVKLSSFLHTHLKNKTISKIKIHNNLKKDATFSKKKRIEGQYYQANTEISKSIAVTKLEGKSEYIDFFDSIDNGSSFMSGRMPNSNDLEFETYFKQVSEKVDEKTGDLLKSIYYDGLGIYDAAKKSKISYMSALKRLKILKNKGYFKNFS